MDQVQDLMDLVDLMVQDQEDKYGTIKTTRSF